MPEIITTEPHNIRKGCEAVLQITSGEVISGVVKSIEYTDQHPEILMHVFIQDKHTLETWHISILKTFH